MRRTPSAAACLCAAGTVAAVLLAVAPAERAVWHMAVTKHPGTAPAAVRDVAALVTSSNAPEPPTPSTPPAVGSVVDGKSAETSSTLVHLVGLLASGVSVFVAAVVGVLQRRRSSDGSEPAMAMMAYYSEERLRAMEEATEYFVKVSPRTQRRDKGKGKLRGAGVLRKRFAPPPPPVVYSTDIRLNVDLLLDHVGEDMLTDRTNEEGMTELMQALWFIHHTRRWRKGREHIGPPPLPVCHDGILEWDGVLALVVNVASGMQGSNKNLFLEGGRRFVWRPSNGRSLDTAALQTLLRMAERRRLEVLVEGRAPRVVVHPPGPGPHPDPSPAASPGPELAEAEEGEAPTDGSQEPVVVEVEEEDPAVLLFCRTSKRLPYVYCGRLQDLIVDAETKPYSPTFLWTLTDHEMAEQLEPFQYILAQSGSSYVP
eukprot:EG_transcript_7401